jgi:hypothetical protein
MEAESFAKLNETTDGRIRLTQVIADPKEIRNVAKRLKLSHLIHKAHETIHYWADKKPDVPHLVTARDTYAKGLRGFCVLMAYYPNGMMMDLGLMFDFDATVSWDEANAAMIDMAEGITPLIAERLVGATECACCGWREPENLKDGEMCI